MQGLRLTIIEQGKGPIVEKGDMVTALYNGLQMNSEMFGNMIDK